YRELTRRPDSEDRKARREHAEEACRHIAKAILANPYTCDDDFLATWAAKWERQTLKFGPVRSLSVGAAYEVGVGVSKLSDDYQLALRRAAAHEHSAKDAELLETPLFIARGSKFVPYYPGESRLLVIDMVATDEEI